MNELLLSLVELIRRTSAEIPEDVNQALIQSLENEKKGTIAESALKIIEQNIALAKQKSQPICQDTGSILFYVDCPVGYDQIAFGERPAGGQAGHAERVSAAELSGFAHRQERRHQRGARRAGAAFSPAPLPGGARAAGAQGRRLRKRGRAILPAHREAVGQPGSGRLPQGDPGRGVAGAGQGLRAGHSGRVHRRRPGNRLRILQEPNFSGMLATATRSPNWTRWNRTSLKTANEAGHRSDGFWRQDDAVGSEDLAANRVPASYFVSVSYMCWAFRRQGVTLDADGEN